MKIAFTAARNHLAREALTELTVTHGQHDIAHCDVIVALGGDGHVMRTLFEGMEAGKSVYALRRTKSVGFLCNDFTTDQLVEKISAAQSVVLHPLRLEATDVAGKRHTALAINEVTVIRETPQSARLKISVDGVERLSQFSGDGILVATPAGSTAYNRSCNGPIMPLDSRSLVMTAISGFLPRGWSHAILPEDATIEIEALEVGKRPVRLEAGLSVIHQAQYAKIKLAKDKHMTLLFNPDEHLGERIIREQFMI
ncbi:MAG: NAD kinase [Alphaproteobacteria bacterium]|nr:NAD kinase [Alphaproteobacteria bacterium]MBV8548309.1 NAD kinase [Alphaproteobacteria bacterium]